MAKSEDGPEPCGTCQGAQGEWMTKNGREEWVSCTACNGTGAK